MDRKIFTPRLSSMAMSVALALMLAACGGGSDGDPVAINPPADNNPPPTGNNPPPTDNNPPPTDGVVTVTTLSQQAAANTRYRIAPTDPGTVVVTLPASAGLAVGDTVAVEGVSANAWDIAQQPGQVIATPLLQAGLAPQVLQTPGGDNLDNWWYTASSRDGQVLAAIVNFSNHDGGAGDLYWSEDGGQTWRDSRTVAGVFPARWSSVQVSADGTRIAASVVGGGVVLYERGNPDLNWAFVGPATDEAGGEPGIWLGLAMSATGERMAVVSKFGYLYTKEGFNTTSPWVRQTQAGQRDWASIASSADGQQLVAVAHPTTPGGTTGGGVWLYNGADTTPTWTQVTSPGAPSDGYRVASSADGRQLYVGIWKLGADESYTTVGPRLYSSSDRGATWRALDLGAPVHQVSASDDGLRAVAAIGGLPLHVTTDGGVTWQPLGAAQAYRAAAISGDGNTVVAGDHGSVELELPPTPGGRLYVARSALTTTGNTGALSGGQGDAATLTYTGNGRFELTQRTGNLTGR